MAIVQMKGNEIKGKYNMENLLNLVYSRWRSKQGTKIN